LRSDITVVTIYFSRNMTQSSSNNAYK